MTEVIHERSPRSRGRVRCDDCGRRIPKGERYRRATAVDGSMIWDWRECQPCKDVSGYVASWGGPYSEDCYADDFYEWAQEAVGGTSATGSLFLLETLGMWVHYLTDLAESAAACAAADADPAQAWDDEAWAAFTWRMQTSPVFNARSK